MVRPATLLAFCFYCAYVWIPTNPDQSTGATALKVVAATQISAIPKIDDSGDARGNVMQFPKSLLIKIDRVERLLPQWIEKNGSSKVKEDYEKLKKHDREDRWEEAENAADAILKTIKSEDRGE